VGTTTKLTFEEFQKLPEREGAIYELDEGELLMEPSPALRHNLIRQRIAMKLIQFVESRSLGIVVEEWTSGSRLTQFVILMWLLLPRNM